MAYIITNTTPATLILDGVEIPPNMPLPWAGALTEAMTTARDSGALRVMDGDETLEERRADIAAINSFKPGNV